MGLPFVFEDAGAACDFVYVQPTVTWPAGTIGKLIIDACCFPIHLSVGRPRVSTSNLPAFSNQPGGLRGILTAKASRVSDKAGRPSNSRTVFQPVKQTRTRIDVAILIVIRIGFHFV